MKALYPLLLISTIFAGENKNDAEIAKISEGLGYLVGKNLENLGVPLDVKGIAKGIQKACNGESSPLSEDECFAAISLLQKSSLIQASEKNLEEAEQFLKANGEKENIVEIEKEKLQYEILVKGKGHRVEPYNSPLIEYQGTYLDGTVFGSTKEPELISLDETIDGFRKGIIGMREGEKRRIYIHPDLGYGESGFLSPNSLITFEVEVVKADGANSAKMARRFRKNQEIASPGLEEEKKLQ